MSKRTCIRSHPQDTTWVHIKGNAVKTQVQLSLAGFPIKVCPKTKKSCFSKRAAGPLGLGRLYRGALQPSRQTKPFRYGSMRQSKVLQILTSRPTIEATSVTHHRSSRSAFLPLDRNLFARHNTTRKSRSATDKDHCHRKTVSKQWHARINSTFPFPLRSRLGKVLRQIGKLLWSCAWAHSAFSSLGLITTRFSLRALRLLSVVCFGLTWIVLSSELPLFLRLRAPLVSA